MLWEPELETLIKVLFVQNMILRHSQASAEVSHAHYTDAHPHMKI